MVDKLKIAYDNKFGKTIAAGIGVYVREVELGLKKHPDVELILLYQGKDLSKMSYQKKNAILRLWGNFKEFLRVQIFIPYKCWREKADVLFCPYQQIPWIKICPRILTVYDFVYKKFPSWERKWWFLRLVHPFSIKRAEKIITISNKTKEDLLNLYKIDCNKVEPVLLGSRFDNKKMKDAEIQELFIRRKVPERFILSVGTLSKRKNLSVLIEAFAEWLSIKKENVSLVIVGAAGWKMEDFKKALDKYAELEKHIKLLGFVSDVELKALYQKAIMFVYPSLYEGFGFPVLEAMQNGSPVICSNTSSLPEVGGDAVIYFSPDQISDLSIKMQEFYYNDSLRQLFIGKGYKQAEKFSWDKHVAKLLEIFKRQQRMIK